MILRRLAWFVAALLLLTAAWSARNSEFVRGLLGPGEQKAKPFQFDNGTRREFPEPVQAKPGQPPALPQGALRKCQRGGETVYTDVACPRGYTQAGVSGGTLNVVRDQAQAAPKAATAASGAASGPHARLQQALDLKPDEQLRQRIMERAIQSEGR
ncbi:hypothetical protein HNP55_004157 [Paucibacter oligotrophus]|uniref:DUF4124 domain-containing protein n=1 Tax=Roseateles oligotrophus TaxID=1769250 RepID=A0A840LF30_9BURK|nr:hypothetical protein [Roseateles oligotrophus]MBB4845605.1 hypothetical protein [Roseateles oligotrophus]